MANDSQTASQTHSAGRPRSEEAHQAILSATLELLAETGYSGLTVEGVATRAGVGKATIYRRWPSKLPLVIEAFRRLPAMEEVDTGDLVSDLQKMLREPLTRALERGVERGELSPELDLELAADLIVGPIAVKLFFSGAKVHPRMVDPVVELALAGIRGVGRGDG
jgi:AcrR family transcriptional regulator